MAMSARPILHVMSCRGRQYSPGPACDPRVIARAGRHRQGAWRIWPCKVRSSALPVSPQRCRDMAGAAAAAYPAITQVMQRLRDASAENHLPAFERCAAKG